MRARVIGISSAAAALFGVLTLGPVATAQAPQNGGGETLPPLEVKTTKLSDNFYVITGNNCPRVSSCASVGAQIGPDGVFMIDTGSVPDAVPMILAEIRKLTDRPIKYMVLTHVHGDHTAGNETVGKMGATLLSTANLRKAYAYPAPGANGQAPPAPPAAGIPSLTYQGRTTVYMNGDAIDLVPLPASHTNGDTMIRIPNADAIMTGDVFRNLGFPDMNLGSGGTMKGMFDALAIIIGAAGPNTKIVPGHSPYSTPFVDRARVVFFRDMLIVMRDRVQAQIKAGKSLDDILKMKLYEDYMSKLTPSPRGSGTPDGMIRQLHSEITSGGL